MSRRQEHVGGLNQADPRVMLSEKKSKLGQALVCDKDTLPKQSIKKLGWHAFMRRAVTWVLPDPAHP